MKVPMWQKEKKMLISWNFLSSPTQAKKTLFHKNVKQLRGE
jgi:hypothetical protein